ncbi:MAG: phage terminase large subunit [Alphaproteobacteria bacterium]|nr:phage terminase large subunit [Alphaproteobacteria bacterium]
MSGPTLSPTRLLEAVLRQDLSSFIAKSFHTLNPGIEYQPNWHIDLIAAYLEAVTQGEIKRLIINMPPRALKSVTVTVSWPAWLLGRNPATRIIAASYSQALSTKHSVDCRALIQSPWYRQLFPDTQLSKTHNQKQKFMTSQHGFRFATSVGGTATGEGADILIIDDPLSAAQAQSATRRMRAIEWFEQTFMSRLNDKSKGAVVMVMQRLHPDDLTGYLLQKPEHPWTVLSLPAICPYTHSIQQGRVSRLWQEGELLQSTRESKAILDRLCAEMGSYVFSAQYLQKPLVSEGGMVDAKWFVYRSQELIDALEFDAVVQSWDTAIKAVQVNDYSVCMTWGICDLGLVLLDVARFQLEYPELKRTCLLLAGKWKPVALLIEDTASGQSLLQDIRRETQLACVGIRPKGDKISRLAAVTPIIEAGRVVFPKNAPWLHTLEQELLAFPHAKHDDQVDALSQFLTWSKQKSARIRIRSWG